LKSAKKKASLFAQERLNNQPISPAKGIKHMAKLAQIQKNSKSISSGIY
jgi:hypothetical protein